MHREESESVTEANAHGVTALRGNVWATRTLAVIGVILVLRLVSLWFNATELFFDEAQYWLWGTEPAFGYFSKPPLLAWIIGATTAVCGNSEFCVRLPSPVIHAATAWMVYLIAERLFDARTAFWSATTYSLLPAVSLSAGLISTDVPLLFLWSVALYAFLRFEESGRLTWAILLGAALGLGVLAKYAMLYFLLCTALYSLVGAGRPGVLGRPLFWVSVAVALLIVSPNIWWNVTHDFATVGHTGENIGWGRSFPNFGGFAEFFGSQFAVMGPIMFGMFIATLVRLPREGMSRTQGFLIAFSVPVLVLILFQALMSKAYANWAALTYVAGTILTVDIMLNRIPGWWLRVSTILHAWIFAILLIAVAFSRPGELPLPEERDPFSRMYGAVDIAADVRPLLADGDYSAILVDDRRMAALMHYYLRDAGIPILSWQTGPSPRDHFELTRAWQDKRPSPVLYLTRNSNPARVISGFADAELMATHDSRSREIGKVSFYALREPRPAGE
jgi:4-amino-4-deoxy-L-arabinose transferase-like glycosyltransferase